MDPLGITRHRGDYLWGSFYREGADGLIETRDPATGVSLDQVPWRRASVDSAMPKTPTAPGRSTPSQAAIQRREADKKAQEQSRRELERPAA